MPYPLSEFSKTPLQLPQTYTGPPITSLLCVLAANPTAARAPDITYHPLLCARLYELKLVVVFAANTAVVFHPKVIVGVAGARRGGNNQDSNAE